MLSQRARFDPTELAVVLSRFDVGVIESAKEYPRGSRRSPKLILETPSGRLLLKRRSPIHDTESRVQFSHALMRHLRARGFPVPAARTLRRSDETVLHYDGHVYELFEYVAGERFDGSLAETLSAGKTLAKLHHAVADYASTRLPGSRAYHGSPIVKESLNAVPTTAAGHDSVIGHEAELLSAIQELHERYDHASAEVEQAGFASWEPWIIHGDWHPGNLLFSEGRVAVVLDLDAAKTAPRVLDVANGMLQFSILRGGGEPDQWPAFFDEARMRRFFVGYLSRARLEPSERTALPALMIESLIAECAVPIAMTGSFGHMPGFGVVQMVKRKVRWIAENRVRMTTWMKD